MKFKRIFHYYFGTIVGLFILLTVLIPWMNTLIFLPIIAFVGIIFIPLNMIGILNVITLFLLYFLFLIFLLIFQYAYLYKFTRQKVVLVFFYFFHMSIFLFAITLIHVNTGQPNSHYLLFKISTPLPLFGICFDLTMKEYYKEKSVE
jgi:hypothetical protein